MHIIICNKVSLLVNNSTLTVLSNSSLTFLFTIIGGLIVLVIGQIIIKFILEPIQGQKKIISEISSSLSYYANIYTQPGYTTPEIQQKASLDIRHISTDLKAITNSIPKYDFFESLEMVKPKEDIFTACEDLMGISNNLGMKDNADQNTIWSDEVKKLLDI